MLKRSITLLLILPFTALAEFTSADSTNLGRIYDITHALMEQSLDRNAPYIYGLKAMSNDLYRARLQLQNILAAIQVLSTNKTDNTTLDTILDTLGKRQNTYDWSIFEMLERNDDVFHRADYGIWPLMREYMPKIEDIRHSVDEYDALLTNIGLATQNTDQNIGVIKSILGGNPANANQPDGLNTGNTIWQNTLKIANAQNGVTNNLNQINTDLKSATNLLELIRHTLATNTLSISNTNLINLAYTNNVDLSQLETDLDTLVRQFEQTISDTYFEDYFREGIWDTKSGFLPITWQQHTAESIDSVTGSIHSVAYNTEQQTNITSRIADRLDGWDGFYKYFTNTLGASTPIPVDSYLYVSDNGYWLGSSTVQKSLSPMESIRYYIQDNNRKLGYINNALTYQHYYNTTNNITRYLKELDLYFQTNYLNNTALRTFLMPNSWDNSTIFTPTYYYKGANNSGPIFVQNTSQNRNLLGFVNVLMQYIPNTLASINNYLNDIYAKGVSVKNIPTSISISNLDDLSLSASVTNILNLSLTNQVNVSVTNNLENWEIISDWVKKYQDTAIGEEVVDYTIVYDDFDTTNLYKRTLDNISLTGDYLQDHIQLEKRMVILLSSINKSLLKHDNNEEGDILHDINDTQNQAQQDESNLRSQIDGKFDFEIDSATQASLTFSSLPRMGSDTIPRAIEISIPLFNGSNDYYNVKIETERISDTVQLVRACCIFLWSVVLSLLGYWLIMRIIHIIQWVVHTVMQIRL